MTDSGPICAQVPSLDCLFCDFFINFSLLLVFLPLDARYVYSLCFDTGLGVCVVLCFISIVLLIARMCAPSDNKGGWTSLIRNMLIKPPIKRPSDGLCSHLQSSSRFAGIEVTPHTWIYLFLLLIAANGGYF